MLACMRQLTVRADAELVERVKAPATGQGRSMNDYVTAVLDAATDPDLAGDEAARVRERLSQAGLLAASALRRQRPDSEQAAAARVAAAGGTPLSELVERGRGERLRRLLGADFEADYFGVPGEEARLMAVVPTAGVLERAARLCAVHGLRAFDAVQLGSALAVRDVEPACDAFAVFDERLRPVAAAEGFALVPPV